MSRGIKDLRELICVSRLSYHDSNDEIVSDDCVLSDGLDSLSLSSEGRGSRDSSAGSQSSRPQISPEENCFDRSPDSGCVPNTGSSPVQSITIKETANHPKKRKKKKKKELNTLPAKHELPRSSPLPPVTSNESFSYSEPASKPTSDGEASQSGRKTNAVRSKVTNFDSMLAFMDATIVSGWLTRANEGISNISSFMNISINFVEFAHFWLTEFPDGQKREIFELEFDILSEETTFAFTVGIDQRKVSQTDIVNLIGAIFHEYPNKLLGVNGGHLFLYYLSILSSGRTNEYKKLLSEVKCSTQNRQYAQWILATRSFSLVSIWSAIVNFYRNCKKRNNVYLEETTVESEIEFSEQHLCQAVNLGYTEVVHFLVGIRNVNPRLLDSHNRSLIFIAVMQGRVETLQYLLTMITPGLDVNVAADTGNTTTPRCR
ncbi:hypothetical protein ScPMuIL_003909 [Solemya velum]